MTTDAWAPPPPAGTDGISVADLLASPDPRSGDGTHLSSGFEVLDQALGGGVRYGDLALVGGAPGAGKTIGMLQWARNAATAGHRVVFLCYEHDERTLLRRLLTLELGDLVWGRSDHDTRRAETILSALVAGADPSAAGVESSLIVRTALARLEAYADRLILVRGSRLTDAFAIERLVERFTPNALFVDYLQKIPVNHGADESTRVTAAVELLKDLALHRRMAAIAAVAGNEGGLAVRRLRMHHLRGADALAYEADVVVMLNEKLHAVSKRHSAFDAVKARTFARQTVFTVEKNRDGLSDVNVEFEKDFEHYRFVPTGGYVAERLVDERLVVD